jgi:hypothetical protein
MKDAPHVDTKALRSDIIAGLDSLALVKKYRISEAMLGKLIVQLIESGDLRHEDLAELYSVSEIIRALTWECPYCRKVVPAAYDVCTKCGNPRP